MGTSTPRFRDPRLAVEARVADLLVRLTPEEKVGQLTSHPLPADSRLDSGALQPAPGFVVAPAGHWADSAARIRALQEQIAGAGPLGIPVLVLTLRDFSGAVRFPGPLGRAASWNQDLTEEVGAAAAFEARAGGAAARLGPVLAPAFGSAPPTPADRDQSLGGDPVLAAELGAAHVRGAQGSARGRIRPDGGAVVISHFGAVASQLGGSAAHAHERLMRSCVLVPVEAAVRAGAMLAIPTRSANAGVPAHADSWLLRDVLRREWGFEGVVMAAPGAVDGLVAAHRVAADLDAAHAMALEAGIDVLPSDTTNPAPAARLGRLLRQGALPSWLLDDAVRAVLRLKMILGLFEDAGPLESRGRVGGRAHRELARRATVESLVLLADAGGVLPLAATPAVDVVCADPGAGVVPDTALLAQALAAALPECVVRNRADTAGDVSGLAGTVVAIVPGDPAAASANVSRIIAGSRRCVAVVCSGDVDGVPDLASTTAAVLLCWQPLAEQATAVAAVLAGAAEPGGRLPVDLYDRGGYPLGHGSGYTSFEYSQLQIAPQRASGAEPVVVQFRLTNTGTRAGKEVAQVYLHDRVSSVRRPARQLAGFAAVALEPGRSRRVRIPLPPSRLAVWDRTMRLVVEPGDFDVMVGRSATDIRVTGTFTVGAGDRTLPGP